MSRYSVSRQWSFDIQEANLSDPGGLVFMHLWDRYEGGILTDSRPYHNIFHPEGMSITLSRIRKFEEFEPVFALISDDDILSLQFAIWYHDAIYVAGADDNEKRSAAYALKSLKDLKPSPSDDVLEETERLILLTERHDPEEDDVVGQLLCDLDLLVLSGDENYYGRYVINVRAEYDHIDQRTWREGRQRFVEGMLARDRIYHVLPEANERAARYNLEDELRRLKNATDVH